MGSNKHTRENIKFSFQEFILLLLTSSKIIRQTAIHAVCGRECERDRETVSLRQGVPWGAVEVYRDRVVICEALSPGEILQIY